MNDDKLKNLLANADYDAGRPSPVEVDISAIAKRARRARIYKIVYPTAAAAIVIFALCLLTLSNNNSGPAQDPTQFAKDLEAKIKQFNVSMDSTVNLVQETLEQERSEERLRKLEAELASIPNPIDQVNEELDKTAFTLVFAADKMYKELNLTDSAVDTYKRVIKLFPDNQWAEVARERLEDIKKRNDKNSSKGDSKWQEQKTVS